MRMKLWVGIAMANPRRRLPRAETAMRPRRMAVSVRRRERVQGEAVPLPGRGAGGEKPPFFRGSVVDCRFRVGVEPVGLAEAEGARRRDGVDGAGA